MLGSRRGLIGLLLFVIGLLASVTITSSDTYASDVPTLTLKEVRAKHELPTSRYMDLGGVDLHYIDEGSGEALVFLHASYNGLHTWEGIASKLKSKYRVVRFDFPNAGLSGPETIPVPSEKFDLVERNYETLVRPRNWGLMPGN